MENVVIAWVLFGCALIVPVALLAGGKMLRGLDGSKPNSVVGFRTKLSMSSQEAWDYANDACGTLWGRLGWILFAASAAAMSIFLLVLAPKWSQPDSAAAAAGVAVAVITGVQIVVMLLSIARVQKELRLRFGENDHTG